jgi:hypothetical protein
MNIKIQIIQNDYLKKICLEYNLESPLVYSKLIYLSQIRERLSIIDTSLSSINFIKILVNDGLLLEKGNIYSLSAKGNSLLDLLVNNIKVMGDNNEAKMLSSPTELIDSWISDWLSLWKDDDGKFFQSVSDSGKRSLGSTKNTCIENFTTFFKKYSDIFPTGVDKKSIIFGATKDYINRFKAANMQFAYCNKANYFICKYDESKKLRSTLAEECENYIENGPMYETKTSPFNKSLN